MKLNHHFTLAPLGNEHIAVPLDNAEAFRGVVKLNDSGAEIFRGLIENENEEQLVRRLMDKYPELDKDTAAGAVTQVLKDLKAAGLLED